MKIVQKYPGNMLTMRQTQGIIKKSNDERSHIMAVAKDDTVTVRIPIAERESLETIATRKSVSVSTIIRQAVRAFIADEDVQQNTKQQLQTNGGNPDGS